MRSLTRRAREDDEQESSFVSMTDLTVSFLFIVMLLMAFFAARYATDPVTGYISEGEETRRCLLEELRQGIEEEFPNLVVHISAEGDALQLQGEGLFETNESSLKERPRRIVRSIAETLQRVLPCCTTRRALPDPAHLEKAEACSEHYALIDAVQIEGHTDTQGEEMGNMVLSAARANVTFGAMVEHERGLTEHLNIRGFPVLSVAGYGWMRPVADNKTPEGRSRNRRIDLRVIMYTPAGPDYIPAGPQDVERVMALLRDQLEGA